MATPRISIGAGKKESLEQMAARYKILAEPKTVYQGLVFFTLKQDWKLYKMLKQDPQHPKDTGLLKESWIPPATVKQSTMGSVILDSNIISDIQPTQYFSQYKGSFVNKKFNVYVLNTATVGEQARRKAGIHRKKKLTGRHNLKRYMPWVDKRTGFYSKKLRIIKQGLDKDWKSFVRNYLEMRYDIT